MEIKELLNLVRKWWILIFALFGASLAIAAFVSFYYLGNVYEAKAVMIISSPKDQVSQSQLTLNDYNLNIKLVNSYRVLCKTDRIMSQVLAETGLPLTTKELSEKISVTAQSDTEIIDIAAQDADPATAAKLANAMASVFIREIPRIMQMDNVQIIDPAAVPQIPVKPDKVLILVIGGVLGLILGIGISLTIEYLDVRIKDTEQLAKLMEAPVLGTIPHLQERARQ